MYRKVIYHASLFISALCLTCALVHCACIPEGPVDRGQSSREIFVDAVPNDLAQVMVLTKDRRGNRSHFIKDFYRRGEPARRTHARMDSYIRSAKKLRGKEVVLRYTTTAAGDRTIISIEPAAP